MPDSATIDPAEAWRLSPAGFSRQLTGLVWPAHLRLVSQVLVLVATGRIKRLTVSMPPGTSKSTAIVRTFPAWLLDLWPNRRIIASSYVGVLIVEHGKAARDLLVENERLLRVRLATASATGESWKTTAGGGMHCAGIGGSITGRRAHIGIVDDPFAGFDDAHSENQRQHVWNFWTGTMRTRLVPGASQIVLQTRWHSMDLIGMLLANDEALEPSQRQWTSLRLPAIAEVDETIDDVLGHDACERLRAMGVVLPDWHRKQGAALWPWNIDPETGEVVPWYDEEEMASVRADIGEYAFAGLYQQRPAVAGGTMFHTNMWDRADIAPVGTRMIRAWDLAATKDGGDETCGALVTRDEPGYVYVVDLVHGRWNESEVEQVMRRTAQSDAEKYGKRVRQKIEQEPGSGGAAWARRLVREVLAGFDAYAEGSSGDKETRARPLAAQQQAGFVRLVRIPLSTGGYGPATWFDPLTAQAAEFPGGKHDDLVDAVSAAYNELVGRGRQRARATSARKVRLPS